MFTQTVDLCATALSPTYTSVNRKLIYIFSIIENILLKNLERYVINGYKIEFCCS